MSSGYPQSERANYKVVIFDDTGLVALTWFLHHAKSDKAALVDAADDIRLTYKTGALT